ncbi:MAG: DUF1636 domain-containing protein [Methyloceanibacter sp.]
MEAVRAGAASRLSSIAPRERGQPSDGVELSQENRPQLFVCVSCQCGGAEAAPDGAATDGRRLFDALQSLTAEMGAGAPVQLRPMLCFANCERGCSVGIAAPGKWSYLMGDLGPEHAADLLTYCATYAEAKTGVVLPSKRPASMQTTVIARFPSQLEQFKDAAE